MGGPPEPPRSERIAERLRRQGLLPESHPNQPWLHAWFHILRLAGIFFVLVNFLTGTIYAFIDADFDPLSATGMFLIFVGQLAILADLWEPGRDRHAVAAVTCTLVGLLLTEAPNPGNSSPSGAWWQMLFLISALLYSAGRFDGVLRWGLLAAVVLVHGGMRLWEWRQASVLSTLAYSDRYAIELGQLVMIGASVVIAMWAGARG
nr:hypothetical protein [Actinomycetales bacterium]